MLTTLRNSAQGIFAKIILFLLVGSFVLWGIGDIFRSGGSAGSVATVGRTSISTQEFQGAVHRRQEELRQMLGANYKPELLKKLGVEQQVLFNLINHLVIEKETAALGIEVGEDDVRDAIRSTPAFQDSAGHFDKSLYQEILKSNGLAEQRFISDLRKDIAAKLLSNLFISSTIVNEDLVQALYKAREEQRSVDIIVIPASGIKHLPEADEKNLQDYYNNHEKSFYSPEYRTFSYIELTPEIIKDTIDVPESEIKQVYEEHIQDYRKPERRVIRQMLFDNEGDAGKASAKLATGAHFNDVAKSAPIINKDKLLLGTISRQDMLPEAAEEVFALPQGAVSKPVHSAFGWHIFQVEKIEPESTQPLAAVKEAIAKDLATKSTQETVYKLANTLEDTLAGGATLEAAAEKIGQKPHTIGPITREGISPEGKKVTLPADVNFINMTFSTNENEHSQATQMADGGYFLIQMDKVTPERLKPFSEVKNDVLTAWKEEKRHVLLQQAAEKIAKELQKNESSPTMLADPNVTFLFSYAGKLKHDSKTIPEGSFAGKPVFHALLQAIFSLSPHESTHAFPTEDGGYMIATLKNIFPMLEKNNKAATAQLDKIRAELKTAQPDEKLHYYMAYLRSKYRVSINEVAITKKDEGSE